MNNIDLSRIINIFPAAFHYGLIVPYLILCSIILLIFWLFYRRGNDENGYKNVENYQVLDQIEDGVIAVTSATKIFYANGMAAELLKTSKEKLPGKSLGDVFEEAKGKSIEEISRLGLKFPNDKMGVVKIYIDVINDGKNSQSGLAVILKKQNGDEKLARELVEKLEEADKKINQLSEARKKLEVKKQEIENAITEGTKTLNEEHTRLFASINNLNLGFIMTDRDINIIMTNKAAKNIFYLPFMDVNLELGEIQEAIKGKIDLEKNLIEAIRSGTKFSYQDVMAGDKFVNIFISPVIVSRDKSEDIIGAVILVEDKTEDRITEKSKENFFVIASHELRTPLTGIKGYIAIIKQFYFDTIHNEELKKIIDDIDSSSTRLINIVNDFLDTTKFEQDKITVKDEACDLVDITRSCVKETTPIASEKKLYLNFNTSLDKAEVRGDKDRIKQIIINLISNGVKYSDKGGIDVRMEKTSDNFYKITVEDTGKGIPEENVKSLFSKYQQIEANKKKNVISTGLGLYISKILAEKMHGIIKLEKTNVQEGSVFSLAFPVLK